MGFARIACRNGGSVQFGLPILVRRRRLSKRPAAWPKVSRAFRTVVCCALSFDTAGGIIANATSRVKHGYHAPIKNSPEIMLARPATERLDGSFK